MSRVPYTVRHPKPYDVNQPLRKQLSWADGLSDNDAVEYALNNGVPIPRNGIIRNRRSGGGGELVAEVYRLFALQRSYPAFSNTSWQWRKDKKGEGGHRVEGNGGSDETSENIDEGRIGEYVSLESIHNSVHIFIGGLAYGHMSENEVAGFDPIFWMHHG